MNKIIIGMIFDLVMYHAFFLKLTSIIFFNFVHLWYNCIEGVIIVKMLKLNEKVRTLWIIRNLIVVLALLIFYVGLGILVENQYKLVVLLSVGFPLILIVGLLIVWPFLKYNCYNYGFDDKRIYINFGVIFKHKILVPIRQIQDLHLYNGPIMSMLDLSGVIISTAGSNFTIAGLLKNNAESVVKELELLLNERLDGDLDEEI